MKHWYLFILLICLGTVPAHAQTEQEIMGIIAKANSEIRSLECGFVQTKSLRILNDKMVSDGRMYYVHPGKLRWEYVTPYSYTFVLNGDKASVKDSGRSDTRDIGKNRNFRRLTGMIMGSLTGEAIADDRTFITSVEEMSGGWAVTLVPRKSEMKQMWKSLVMHFDRKAGSIVKVEINETSGDRTVIEFTDIIKDGQIDDSVFDISRDIQ